MLRRIALHNERLDDNMGLLPEGIDEQFQVHKQQPPVGSSHYTLLWLIILE